MTPAAYNLPPWRVVLVQERRGAALGRDRARLPRDSWASDRLERYLERLDGFRDGVAVALIFVDRAVERELREERGVRSRGRARRSCSRRWAWCSSRLWLAITAEGMVTSLQHWDHLVGPRLAHFAGLPRSASGLVAIMPDRLRGRGRRVSSSAPRRSAASIRLAPANGR